MKGASQSDGNLTKQIFCFVASLFKHLYIFLHLPKEEINENANSRDNGGKN